MKKKIPAVALALATFATQVRATTYQVLRNLLGTDGIAPASGLTFDSSGNLYGSTQTTVFKISNTGTGFTVLHTFAAGLGEPLSAFSLGSDGLLYGTTTGTNISSGTVFKISTTGTYTQLAAFNGSNGSSPLAGLVFDGLGNAIGVCEGGGSNGVGTIYKVPTTGGAITVLDNFDQTNTGAQPYTGLVRAPDGYLYGVAGAGGTSGNGTIYRLTTASNSLTKLADFNGSNGSSPETNLIVNSSNTLFGTTNYGGANNVGNIFSYTAGGVITSLSTFNGTNGSYIEGALLADATGNMYGTTVSGGANGFGTVYEIARTGGVINTLYSFANGSGIYPYSNLIADSIGSLYGTTQETGTSATGTIFKVLASGYIPISAINQNVPSGQINHIAANATGIQLTSLLSESITSGGELIVDAASAIANRRLLVVGQGGLTIGLTSGGAYGGVLDLANNDLLVVEGSLAMVTAEIKSGYNNGTAGTGGIGSSAEAADPKHLHALGVMQNNQRGTILFTPFNRFDGYTPGPTDILVKYTYYGDANLDGRVDGSDYSIIDNGVLTHATGWLNGDFNYDGLVNASDYTLIDNAFNTQGATINTQVSITSQIATITAVPEPTLSGSVVLVILALLRRRVASLPVRSAR